MKYFHKKEFCEYINKINDEEAEFSNNSYKLFIFKNFYKSKEHLLDIEDDNENTKFLSKTYMFTSLKGLSLNEEKKTNFDKSFNLNQTIIINEEKKMGSFEIFKKILENLLNDIKEKHPKKKDIRLTFRKRELENMKPISKDLLNQLLPQSLQ